MSLQTPETAAVSRSRFRFQPYLPLMALTCIIWGAAFPITRLGLADIPPATFALIRFSLAAIVLLPLMLFLRGGWHIARRDWGRIAFAGVMGFSLIQLGQNWGLTFSTASDISILAATEPLSITLLAAYFLGEKPLRAVWLGLLVSLVGVWFVLGINPLTLFSGSKGSQVWGDLIFLGGTLGWAAYNVLGRSLTQRYDGLEVTTGAVMFGIIGLAPFSLLEVTLGGRTVQFSGAAWVGLLYASMLVTVFGFLALFWSLKRIPAARVALLFYLQPVAGVLVSWLGGEQLSWNFGLGACLILAGVYIAERGSQTAH